MVVVRVLVRVAVVKVEEPTTQALMETTEPMAVVLVAVAIWISFEAIERIVEAPPGAFDLIAVDAVSGDAGSASAAVRWVASGIMYRSLPSAE
jgi:hypothetical protein